METTSQSFLHLVTVISTLELSVEGIIRTAFARTLLCFDTLPHKLSHFLNVPCLGKICVLVCLWLL